MTLIRAMFSTIFRRRKGVPQLQPLSLKRAGCPFFLLVYYVCFPKFFFPERSTGQSHLACVLDTYAMQGEGPHVSSRKIGLIFFC